MLVCEVIHYQYKNAKRANRPGFRTQSDISHEAIVNSDG